VASEMINTVPIYEMDGVKYSGAQKINIKAHPRFLGFIRICIADREYSLGVNDLVGAIDRAITQPSMPMDESFDSQTAE
jgi:hypothetical protein